MGASHQESVLARAANEIRRDTVEWVLNVLETGRVLGTDSPCFGKVDVDGRLKERIRVLRAKLGHPDPLGGRRAGDFSLTSPGTGESPIYESASSLTGGTTSTSA